jgi:hypothetical protein
VEVEERRIGGGGGGGGSGIRLSSGSVFRHSVPKVLVAAFRVHKNATRQSTYEYTETEH